ncbi:dynamin family protein [Heliobacterium chlorum]|uniref:Dynamin family protein n=1 Tax=Heliobacterium chlorum TaxID=2698 RepID=A0ABR7T8W7_HELCL|nr:dynamin family protein [Heliobacterium chlorum]MBC9786622.1 dynamin family protein [Heliobacterium chlorum]
MEGFQLQPFRVQEELDLNKFIHQEGYEYKAIELLAAIANLDGYLLPAKFEIYKNLAGNLFKERLLQSSVLRAALLKTFLNGNTQFETLTNDLILSVIKEKVTDNAKKDIVLHILNLLNETQINKNIGINIVEKLIAKFNLPRSEFSKILDNLDTTNARQEFNSVSAFEKTNFWKDTLGKTITDAKNVLLVKSENHSLTKNQRLIKIPREVENEKGKDFASKVKELSKIVHSKRLKEKVDDFLIQIEPKPFRVVLVGEIKHGKSSIFNKIIGESFSPIGEGTATTSSVLELYYSEEPKYEAKWLSEDTYNKILNYINVHSDNKHVLRYKLILEDIISSKEYVPGGVISNLSSSAQVVDNYISARGRFSSAIELVRIGSPLDCLKYGMIIVDTPGINDPMKVRDKITYDQAKVAECVVFVMRADKFGTESERQFLLNLLEAGNLFELIIVLTHIDRLSNDEEKSRIFNEVYSWIRNVSSNQQHQELLRNVNVFAFDARFPRQDTSEYTAESDGFNNFYNHLSTVAEDSNRDSKYLSWLNNRLNELMIVAKEESEQYIDLSNTQFFNRENIVLFEKMSKKLINFISSHNHQINMRLQALCDRLIMDYNHSLEDIEQTRKIIEINFRSAIETKVRELGKDYSNSEKWGLFNRETADGIVQKHMTDFNRRINERLNYWKTQADIFSKELDSYVELNINEFKTLHGEFSYICNTSHFATSTFCKIDEIVNAFERNTKNALFFLGGAGFIGGRVTLGLVEKIFTSIVAISFPPAIPWVAAIGTIAIITHKLTFNADKRKADFIENKIKSANENLDKRFKSLNENMIAAYSELWEFFKSIVEEKSRFIIHESLGTAEEAKHLILLSNRLKSDLREYTHQLINMTTNEIFNS